MIIKKKYKISDRIFGKLTFKVPTSEIEPEAMEALLVIWHRGVRLGHW